MDQDNSPQIVTGLLHGASKAQAIYVAAKLDLAGILAEGPKSTAELAERTNTHEPSLFRLLRALASEGIFAETTPRTFTMTPAAQCLRAEVPNSQRAMAIMVGEEQFKSWSELLYTIQTGEKGFDKIYGMPIFDYLSQQPEQAATFDAAMSSIHGREALPMLAAYDFSPYQTIADIGGGNGSTLMAVLRKYPQAKGMLFDLPHVVSRSEKNFREAGLAERCELVGGDFFASIPAGADLYMFRHIIHDWNDEQCITILTNCRKALQPGGKILILESVIEPGNEPSFAKWLDLTMLVIPGGKERTAEEFRELLAKAGLRLNRIVPTSGGISVIEAVAE
jgi:precorrin-6B methylase 2